MGMSRRDALFSEPRSGSGSYGVAGGRKFMCAESEYNPGDTVGVYTHQRPNTQQFG